MRELANQELSYVSGSAANARHTGFGFSKGFSFFGVDVAFAASLDGGINVALSIEKGAGDANACAGKCD